MKKQYMVLVLFMVIVGTMTACKGNFLGKDQNDKPLQVGAIYPLSGSNALLGNQCLSAVQIAVDMVNQKGGINGRKLELVTADAPDPAAATTEAERLVNQKGVKVIFGSLASGNALAIAGVTDKNGVCLVESGGIADELTDSGFRYVFRILDKGSLRGAAGAKYVGNEVAKELKIPTQKMKIFIIHEDSSYGESVANGAQAKIKDMGMQLVGRAHYDSKIADLSALVLKIKKAKPDVVLSVCYVNDAILLVDTLQQLRAMPKVFMGCGAGTTDPNFASTVGNASDGMFCTDMPTNLPLRTFRDQKLRATVKAFREAFLQRHPDLELTSVAAEAAFSGAYTFMNDILPNVKNLDDPEEIRKAAVQTKLDQISLGFGWDMGEDGQNYAAAANINQWQNGRVITVAPDLMKNGDIIDVPLPSADY